MSKEKVRLSPDKISDKWGRHMKAAVPDIQSGIDAMTEDPGQKAVDAQDKMLAKVTESIQSGIWAKRRLAVPFSEWKEKTKSKVATRLTGGVDAAMPKRKKFDTWLASRLNGVLPEIAAMSDLTLDDSKARVMRMMDYMSAEKYKGV